MQADYSERFIRSYADAPTNIQRAFDRRSLFYLIIYVIRLYEPKSMMKAEISGKLVLMEVGVSIFRSEVMFIT